MYVFLLFLTLLANGNYGLKCFQCSRKSNSMKPCPGNNNSNNNNNNNNNDNDNNDDNDNISTEDNVGPEEVTWVPLEEEEVCALGYHSKTGQVYYQDGLSATDCNDDAFRRTIENEVWGEDDNDRGRLVCCDTDGCNRNADTVINDGNKFRPFFGGGLAGIAGATSYESYRTYKWYQLGVVVVFVTVSLLCMLVCRCLGCYYEECGLWPLRMRWRRDVTKSWIRF